MATKGIDVTAAGASGAVQLDLTRFHYGVGILVYIPSTTTANYTVQVTGQPIDIPIDSLTAWNNHDVLVSKAVSANSNLAYPATALRLYINSMSGPGPVKLMVVQAEG